MYMLLRRCRGVYSACRRRRRRRSVASVAATGTHRAATATAARSRDATASRSSSARCDARRATTTDSCRAEPAPPITTAPTSRPHRRRHDVPAGWAKKRGHGLMTIILCQILTDSKTFFTGRFLWLTLKFHKEM